ncbi:arginine/serine-rich coiled-coil protein 2 isoform X1 [Fagus crenata]
MDADLRSPPPDNADARTAFRKPSTDAANRKYRRHSPISGSSSPDEIHKQDLGSSPNVSRDDPVKVSDYRPRRKDDRRELDRDSNRSHYGRGSDSYRYSDRQSSRGSHGYSRHDDYIHDKHTDEEDRNYKRLSSRSGRESRGGAHSELTGKESELSRSRDYSRHVDKYSRDDYDGHRSKDKDREASSLEHQKYKDKDSSSDRAGSGRRHAPSEELERDRYTRDRGGRDEKRDYRKSSGDYRGDRPSYEETWGHRNGLSSGGDSGKHRLKDAYKSDQMELDGQKLSKEDKKKYNDRESNRDKDQYIREPGELVDDKFDSVSENHESLAKKSKLYGLDKDIDHGKDVKPVSKFSSVADNAKVTPGQGQANDSDAANDLNAAKVAAMKAAELVNRNLVGVGVGSCMTADQKKKLLWGSKKNVSVEESGHRWDTALFSDRERQEKFNKLMGVKGGVKVEHHPNNQEGSELLRAEKEKELQQDLEKQYTAGLRRRDGRTVGLGL